MKAEIKEIRDCGLFIWVCYLNGKEFCRAMSKRGVCNMVRCHIRKRKQND